MHRVTHFEIQAEDPARTIKFYTELLGWTFTQWGGQKYWLITTGEASEPGINGGLLPRPGAGPIDGQAVNAYVCTVATPNVDATLSKALSLGGKLALPKIAIPTVGWLAYAKDTEGNIFGMMQADPSAK